MLAVHQLAVWCATIGVSLSLGCAVDHLGREPALVSASAVLAVIALAGYALWRAADDPEPEPRRPSTMSAPK